MTINRVAERANRANVWDAVLRIVCNGSFAERCALPKLDSSSVEVILLSLPQVWRLCVGERTRDVNAFIVALYRGKVLFV